MMDSGQLHRIFYKVIVEPKDIKEDFIKAGLPLRIVCRVPMDSIIGKEVDGRKAAAKIFEALTRRMSTTEMKKYFGPWLNLFELILDKYFSDVELILTDIDKTMRKLLCVFHDRFQSRSSKVVIYISLCTKRLGVDFVEKFLAEVPVYLLEYVLCSSSYVRPKDCLFKDSHLLMKALQANPRMLVDHRFRLLLNYGIPYVFDKGYYRGCCWKLKSAFGSMSDDILTKGNLRMQLAVEILSILYFSSMSGKYALQLFWKTLPCPLVTKQEMLHLLEPFFSNTIKLQKICDHYIESNIWEVPETLQIRPLKHLARVGIRKFLSEGKGTIDEKISSLNIPQTLHTFLKLEDEGPFN